jgi:hypothetical protein
MLPVWHNTGTSTLPSAPAILKVFAMVICFMTTKLVHLRDIVTAQSFENASKGL